MKSDNRQVVSWRVGGAMSDRARIVIATFNLGKLEEIRAGLDGCNAALLSLQDFPGIPEAPEEATTFEQIALEKARFYHERTGLPVLAEDSGLVVQSLNGYPGIYSARIANSDAERVQVLLSKLKEEKSRSAFYHCSMVVLTPEWRMETEGRCDGQIVANPRGTLGFGYDPIFQPDGSQKTFAEMDVAEKARYSHRSRALQQLLPRLRSWIQTFP